MIDPRKPRWALFLSIAACLVVTLVACPPVRGFRPCFAESSGPIVTRLVESPAPSLTCGALAGAAGVHLEALAIATSLTPACSVWTAGSGWLVTPLGGTPDWMLGHEFRHVADPGFRHLPGIPVDLPCAR